VWPVAILAPVGWVFAVGWSWRALAGRRGWLGAWPAVIICVAMPFALPTTWTPVRIVFAALAVAGAAKSWMAAHGGPRDPAMAAGPFRFALWFLVPPESTWPATEAAAVAVRSRGLRRGGRGLVKLPPAAALYFLGAMVPEVHANRFVEGFWALWFCWLALSALADLVTAAFMIAAGVDFDEVFDTPPKARSPRDFWGNRWNLFVHHFASRYLFLPLGGRHRPALATAGVFACSGAMHEYFVLACLGRPSVYAGTMMAFFALQGAAVLGEMALRRRRRAASLPRSVAVALHLAWLTLTAPLFFAPLAEVFAGWSAAARSALGSVEHTTHLLQ